MIYQKIEKLRVINSGLVSSLLKASSRAEDFATACEHLVKRYELSEEARMFVHQMWHDANAASKNITSDVYSALEAIKTSEASDEGRAKNSCGT